MCFEQIEKCVYGTISRNWELLPIGEYSTTITDFVANGSFAALKENVVYKDSPDVAVLIRLVDFNNGFVGPFVFIDESSYAFLRKSKLFGGEIIISNVGANVGTVFKAPLLPYKMSLAPNSIMLKTKGFNDFYYYWFSSSYGQFALKSIVTGSAQPKFNKTDFRKILVPVPPLPEQRVIAATLSCLDDKIELNNRMNKTLEEMAQAIFKSWFVDFEPFQDGEFVDSELGRIPKGWRVGVLADLLDVKYGKDHKKLPDGDIPVYGSGGLMRYADKAIFTGESVLIPRKGTLSNLMYVNEAFWTVDTMFYTVMKCETVAKYVYQSLLTKDLASMNAGSAVPSMTTDILNHLPVIIPSSSTLDQFDSILAPLYACITSNRQHIAKLVQIRSSLLPKLMSGEIHVPLEVQDGIS